MVRSWAYILMIAATLAGVVALVWPSPEVRTIEEIAMPAKPAPRAEAPAKPKQAPKSPAAKREPAPAPAAVVKRMPAPNTTTRRQTAQPENGMQESPLQRLGSPLERAAAEKAEKEKGTQPPPRPAMPPKPGTPPRPSAGTNRENQR